LITVFFKNLNSNIYIQSKFDLPQGGQNTKISFCLLLFGYWQGHVIVKPNLLILKLIAGYGCLFLVMPYNMAPYWVGSKWFIAS